MYAFVEGVLESKTPTQAIVKAGGLGFAIEISLHTYDRLVEGSNIRLHTQLIVREDALTMYGFATLDERQLFRLLIGVSGIGPNLARTLLSSMTPTELRDAISRKEDALIRAVKGIGAKTAQRLVMELHDKIQSSEETEPVSSQQASAAPAAGAEREEAVTALVMLGFQRAGAEKAVAQILRRHTSPPPVEEIIKQALKAL